MPFSTFAIFINELNFTEAICTNIEVCGRGSDFISDGRGRCVRKQPGVTMDSNLEERQQDGYSDFDGQRLWELGQ